MLIFKSCFKLNKIQLSITKTVIRIVISIIKNINRKKILIFSFEQTQNIHFNEKKYVAAEVLQYEKNAQMKDEFLI